MSDNERIEESEGRPAGLVLVNPAGPAAQQETGGWKLVAYSRAASKGWGVLCHQLPENAIRCYNWLSEDPERRIPKRCYPLKHKHYAGVWGYEIGPGQRVYYRVRHEAREVLVYYAGAHPKHVPYPPKED
jgi:hypothetical protein